MNPVKRIREERGLTRDELCVLCEVSYSVIASLESNRAVSVNRSVLQLLEEWGYDPESVQEEYKEYRQKLRQEIKVKKAKKDDR